MPEKVLKIACALLFFATIAAFGAAFADTGGGWYLTLVKPALLPPIPVCAAVWAALYALLAAALSLVSIRPTAQKKTLGLFVLTGVLAVLWSYAFFQLENPSGALFVLLLMILAAVWLLCDVQRCHRLAAWLTAPYIVWLCFMLYLNYEIAFFN